jgi:hypothetical protein
VTVFRCGETAGTEFGVREQESGRGAVASERRFRQGLLRHTGLLTPEVVAEAITTAVALPGSCQFETLAMIPTAPKGEAPTGFSDWAEAMAHEYLPE